MKEFDYRSVAYVEQRGKIVLRDFMLLIDENVYKLSVATPEYIELLREFNKQFEEELRLDENILPIDSVENVNVVVAEVSKMPWEIVAPYLIRQEEEIEKTP